MSFVGKARNLSGQKRLGAASSANVVSAVSAVDAADSVGFVAAGCAETTGHAGHAAGGAQGPPVRRLSLLEHLAHAALERALATCVADAVFVPHGVQSAENAAAACGPLMVDATAGNGHDSLFLLGAAPRNALLLAMDVQVRAVAATGYLLAAHGFAEAARVLHVGHERLADVLAALAPEDRQRPLACVVFNLGWLPGGNKGLVTTPETSLPALEAALEALAPGGCISLHCYTGHDGGAEEAAALEARLRKLPPRRWRVLTLADANRERAAERLLLAERLLVKKNRV